MTSRIIVNNIQSDAGISTVFFNSDIGGTGGTLNLAGNLNVSGVVTYDDVTNVDSVGIITARKGIVSSGVVTATAFHGDGSQLTGIDATQIVTGNTSVQTVDTGSDGHVKVNTEGSERLRITSDGRIGIGMNPHTSSTGYALQIDGGASSFIQIFNDTSGNTVNDGLVIGNDANTAYLVNKENTPLVFRTNNTEQLRITSGGLVQIGTITTSSFPDRLLSVGDHTRTSSYIDIRSGTVGALLFADGTSGNTAYRGQVEYTHSDDRMCFWTAATERVRISNIGHITTKGNNQGNPVGIEIRNNNSNAYSHAELSLTSQNATTSKIWCDVPNSGMRLNYNGGTSVKINQSGNLVMGNGAGIDFSATSDSSQVMSSELFDDYEEGTWTPTMGFATGYGTQSGKYVKVGKTVHIWFEVQVTGWSTGTGSTWITSGPFPIDKVTGCWAGVINATATTRDWRVGPWTAGGYGMGVWMENGQGSATSAGIRMSENTFSDYSSLTGSLGTNFTMRGGMTYISTV